MNLRPQKLRVFTTYLAFLCQGMFGKEFINLSFNEGVRYPEADAISIPGWSVSYNGSLDSGLNPFLPDGYPSVYVGSVGYLRGAPNYIAASEEGGSLSATAFPSYPGNTSLTLGHNIVYPDWLGGSYVSLSQTADLSLTDRFLWFYKNEGINLTVFANGRALSYATGEFRDPLTHEPHYPHTVVDLSEFAGQKDVTLELRYTTPLKRVSNDDRSRLTVTIDELFFAPTNIPEPSAFALLGLGAAGLWMVSSARSRASRSAALARHPGLR